MDVVDYSSVLNSDLLVSEVAAGTFCFKNKVKAAHVRSLWEKLSNFIADTLQSQKVRSG